MRDGLLFAAGVMFALAYKFEKKFHEFSVCDCRANDYCREKSLTAFQAAFTFAATAHACLVRAGLPQVTPPDPTIPTNP